MNTCVFCKIASHELTKDFTYEDTEIMVFPDIHPIKPIHLLIVPKKHIETFSDLDDNTLLVAIKDSVQKMIQEKGLEEKGYKIVVNGGGLQLVNHLHFHLCGPYLHEQTKR